MSRLITIADIGQSCPMNDSVLLLLRQPWMVREAKDESAPGFGWVIFDIFAMSE
jgi:hypothetical protein